MNEKPLDVWIFANMNGKIECSHCTCIAGLGETCSHVGAICYAISNLWESSERVQTYDTFNVFDSSNLFILEICN